MSLEGEGKRTSLLLHDGWKNVHGFKLWKRVYPWTIREAGTAGINSSTPSQTSTGNQLHFEVVRSSAYRHRDMTRPLL